MLSAPLRALAIGAVMFAVPFGVAVLAAPINPSSAGAAAGQQAKQATDETAGADDQAAPSQTPGTATEDKRICRYVRLDASSRRKTKVCRTTEEWRELNNPR